MEKRCFNTGEALQYLGIKRRSFEAHILPQIRSKGIRVGNCVVFERADLDEAWDRYKIDIGSGNVRSGMKGGTWNAKGRPGYTRQERATTSIECTKVSVFDAVASRILEKRKNG